jgi:succinate dehydrogenase / fumarate reductase, membrane anchor subunit
MGSGTSLGQVRGLGSAKSGTHHWMMQRVTAIANLTLLTWLIVSLVTNDLGSYDTLHRWLGSPFAAAPLALLVVSTFTHLRLGLTVLIEDYLHAEGTKLLALVTLTFFSWGGMIFALFAIAKVAFGAVANVPQ